MAKTKRDAAKEQFWRSAIEQHRDGGLSVREFCREAGFAENSFYAWRRTIDERDGIATKPPFVPAIITGGKPSDESTERPIVVELTSGLTLKLPSSLLSSLSILRIAELVQALDGRPR